MCFEVTWPDPSDSRCSRSDCMLRNSALWSSCLLLTLWGCGGAGASSTPESRQKSAKKDGQPGGKRPPTPATALDPALVNRDDGPLGDGAFASVEEAIDAMRAAADSGQGNRAVRVAQWLSRRGAESLAPLQRLLEDGQAPPTSRIAAVESLKRMGPQAVEGLVRVAESDGATAVRASAIGAVASIQPVAPSTVDRVIQWIDLPDIAIRRAAVIAVGRLGSSAKKCAPRLQSILNDINEDETLRGEAKRALKSVSPRKTLVD